MNQIHRPNVVVETANGEKDFVENAWIGQRLAIGDAVRLSITDPLKTATYNNSYRNVIFSNFSAERLYAIYSRAGVEGVRSEILKLRADGKL